ncbi:flavodoxin [Fructilactobacillus vespulae]|uniref:flavodoxin n=1 Tax=Fructilactobacillus vespulae TaxID=1249630 RepID=UPI0039B45642
MNAKNTLIVYFTKDGNTKILANLIKHHIGGTCFKIVTEEAHPKSYEKQLKLNLQAKHLGILPRIKHSILSFHKYEYIFIGTPTWNEELPEAVKHFLKQYDFSDKVLIPFNINDGCGAGKTFNQIKQISNAERFLPGFAIAGEPERDGYSFGIKGPKKEQVKIQVNNWLHSIS